MKKRKWTLEDAFHHLLIYAEGEGSNREGLLDTPRRAARAWQELMAGYDEVPDLKSFAAEGQGIITQRVTFNSTCEHHGLPFFGTADFAYVPDGRMVGLSKFARLAKVYSRRLQVQERLTSQMADALVDALAPKGVLVITRAVHACMSIRGVQEVGAVTTVSEARGLLMESAQTKAEAMALLGGTT